MELTSIPIIVILCYIMGEIYKFIFQNKKDLYKLIPIILSCFGGVLGIFIYLTSPEIMLSASNVWGALVIGIISGIGSTGTNQIIKQILKQKK